MSGYIDLDYISKIQPRLQQFKKKRDYLYNFRCPVCGDSKKSKTKDLEFPPISKTFHATIKLKINPNGLMVSIKRVAM